MCLLDKQISKKRNLYSKGQAMLRKRNLTIVLLSLVVIAGWWFASTAMRSSPRPEEGVVDVWVSWADDPAELQALFERYDQPVRVRTGMKYSEVTKVLNDSMTPDVIILSVSDPVRSYYEQGLIEELDTYVEAASIDLADFYPAPLAQCEMLDGNYACLPLGSDVDVLYWNKDLFEAAGLDPEQPPQTMEELAEYAEALTLRDQSGEIIQLGFVPDFSRSHTDLYVHMFGGSRVKEGGTRLAVNSQPVIDAMAWQRQFYSMYSPEEAQEFLSSFTPYTPQTGSHHPFFAERRLSCYQCHHDSPASEGKLPDLGFYNGKVAMVVDGEWQLGPNAIAYFQPELNYGVAPFPPSADHPERENTTVVQGPVVVIPAGAVDKEAAADLLGWMTSPEVLADVAYINASLPGTRLAAQDLRFQPIPNIDVFMDLLSHPNATHMRATSISPELNEALSEVEKELLQEGGQMTPLLNEVQVEFAPRLAQASDD
jgi:multiple sugar transport system substrate-binding protein